MRTSNHPDWVRLDKRNARKAFMAGKPVYIMASKMRLDNMWQPQVEMPHSDTFDHIVNAFEYYNCDHERGYHASFYMKRESFNENGKSPDDKREQMFYN